MLMPREPMTETLSNGMRSVYQGDFGEMWVETLASGMKFLHGRPYTQDLDRADVQIGSLQQIRGLLDPHFRVQVKTTRHLKQRADGYYTYQLDVETYNALCQRRYLARRILIVIGVDDERSFDVQDDGTLLYGKALWVCLEGKAVSLNGEKVTVEIPPTNTLTEENLSFLMDTYGAPSSSNVPAYEEGEEV